MNYLILEEQGECSLLLDTRAIERYPGFFANLLSGCQLADLFGRRHDPLHVWQSIQEGHWSTLLTGSLCQCIPTGLEPVMHQGVVALKRSLTRKDGICTIFIERDGEIHVRKCTLAQAASGELTGQRVLPGVACDMYLRGLAARGDWELWQAFVKAFVAEVFTRYSTNDENLVGIAIDAIARNAVIDELEGISFFDLEFSEYGSFSKTFYIYRLSLSLMGHHAEYMKNSGFTCLYEFYCHLCSHFALDESRYFADVRREVAFQSWVAGRPAKRPNYYRGLRPFAPGLSTRQQIQRIGLRFAVFAGRFRDITNYHKRY